MTISLSAGFATDVGNVRANNQDDLLILPGSLYAVADGMGGHASGEVASRETVDTLRASCDGSLTTDGFRDAIRWANMAVWRRGIDEPEHAGMGTTLTAVAVVDDDVLAVANVGDSRTYLLRDGTLSQLTADHSFVQESVRTGQLTIEEAESHPRRSYLTRAIGIGDHVDIDIETLVPRTGDRLLLCSDGLWDELPDEAITSILSRLTDSDAAAEELVRQAKEAGGRDNVTVLVVDVLDAGDQTRAVAASAALVDEPTAGAPAVEADEPAPRAEPGDLNGDDLAPSTSLSDEALLRTPPAAAHTTEAEPSSRLITWRVALFVIALLGVAAFAFMAFRTGASPWKVGLTGNNVAIFKGDAVDEEFPLQANALDEADQVKLRNKVALENRQEAVDYVNGLSRRAAARTLPTVTSTSTAPAPTTATAPTATTATTAPVGP